MKNFIRLNFQNLPPAENEILIALLSELGFDGFEETETELHAFIPEENYQATMLAHLIPRFQPESITLLPATNWNQQWESNFSPVIIDDFVAVRAGFHPPVKNVAHEIVITPKMSFGTGHHATTHMMMQQMREIDFRGKSVFDFGTGTGILAILAQKMGAATITAVDNDPGCIENATENIQNNNALQIDLQMADSISGFGPVDIILANITKNIILENFPLLSRQLNKNGILLLSGLLQDDEDDILTYSSSNQLISGKKLREGNWLCLRFLRGFTYPLR